MLSFVKPHPCQTAEQVRDNAQSWKLNPMFAYVSYFALNCSTVLFESNHPEDFTLEIQHGCGNILGINFFILGIIFFLWFQLEVEMFQVGLGYPCRGGRRLKKKQLEGGCALPPRCIRRTCCMIRLRFLEFWGPWVHNFLSVRRKTSCAHRFIFFVSCVHKSLGPLGSYLFWGLRFI